LLRVTSRLMFVHVSVAKSAHTIPRILIHNRLMSQSHTHRPGRVGNCGCWARGSLWTRLSRVTYSSGDVNVSIAEEEKQKEKVKEDEDETEETDTDEDNFSSAPGSAPTLNCSTIEGVSGGMQGVEDFYQCECPPHFFCRVQAFLETSSSYQHCTL